MASSDKTGPEDVEGSWSPKRPRSTSSKASPAKEGSPDPDALASEIEQTRQDLAESLDAIVDRVSPKKVVGRTKQAAKDGALDAVEAVKGGVAAVKEKVSGETDAVRSRAATASPLPDDTVSMPAAEVPLEPAPTPGALADAEFAVTAPTGGDTPYVSSLPPEAPSRVPVFAGVAAFMVLLYVLKRRRG